MSSATTRAKVVFMISKSSNEGSGVPPKMKLARHGGRGKGRGSKGSCVDFAGRRVRLRA